MSFSQALSGLNAARNQLGVLGNNIANSQTTGFKSSGVQFADVYANSKVGLGVQVSSILQDFSGGNLESTGRDMDLAISGNGFFRFQQAGEVVYSRNGQLTMTPGGELVNAQGAKIMGYGLQDSNDAFSSIAGGGQPVPITVPADDMAASATTQVNSVYNLDASIDQTDPNLLKKTTLGTGLGAPNETLDINYHYSNSFIAYDSLGNAHNVNAYYEKVQDNEWKVRTSIDGEVNVNAGAPTKDLNVFTLNFDKNGQLVRTNGDITGVNGSDRKTLDLPIDSGAESMEVDFVLAGTTQFANESSVKSLTQNGYTAGALVGVTIEDDGSVMRHFSNEQSRAAGQIVLANFRNAEGLKPEGDNVWSATAASGQELVGVAGTGLLGTIEGQALETSNVDMADELVSMIVAQRAYQANSQTIKTQDEILQTAINLR
ncbi:flagellar hook protein FlgE [Pistricoccus aurantiacus]|uniref:Flagellar hook protein FlgE n=1 Tax=Pistricoccus aurantiacus TaxID=1883414 RepID=A0A5B8SXX8_9GAMM|nr:flagellar hook protein FlgE [Pistricoccus aurantiacus]QEA39688.1 flagellar hook protein FlgE [Pistricoccus aurantiacus]